MTTPPTPSGIVHVIAASLRADVPADLRETTLARAHALREAPAALRVLVGHSDTSIVVATWLATRADLERFAASPPHMEFVMRGLAPSISSMWSAAVETSTPPPAEDVATLWAFAVRTSETAFEWQVRDILHSLEALPAVVAAGSTFEERDRYRAAGVACIPAGQADVFSTALGAARARWGDLAPFVVESTAQVIP